MSRFLVLILLLSTSSAALAGRVEFCGAGPCSEFEISAYKLALELGEAEDSVSKTIYGLRSEFKKWAEWKNPFGLEEDEQFAFFHYTFNFYLPLNRDLWKNHGSSRKYKPFVSKMLSGLNKIPEIKGDFRRNMLMARKDFESEFLKPSKNPIIFYGFTSASADPAYSGAVAPPNKDQDVVSIGTVIRSARAHDISSYSQKPSEREVLLKPGAAFCKTQVTKVTDDVYQIELRETQQNQCPKLDSLSGL